MKVLSNIERMTYGKCETCGAKHGKRCDILDGAHCGVDNDGAPVFGVHKARLENAPVKVEDTHD